MNNLTLKQLRYFEALSRHKHFGRAAEDCAISQPALSVQIRELEETLGLPLFERSTRQVRLTGFGEDLAERARDILRSVDELDTFATAARDRMIGRLRFGVIPTIAPYLLPGLIRDLTETYRGLEVWVRETQTHTLIDELNAGRLDVALLALPVSENSLTEYLLFSEDFVLIRPDADAGTPPPGLDQLQHMKLLLLEEGHCFRDQALSFCQMNRTATREMMDASSLSTLVQLVSAGIGVTLIPHMALPVETKRAKVDITRFGSPRPERHIGLVWRKSSPLTPQLRILAEEIREASLRLLPGVRAE